MLGLRVFAADGVIKCRWTLRVAPVKEAGHGGSVVGGTLLGLVCVLQHLVCGYADLARTCLRLQREMWF